MWLATAVPQTPWDHQPPQKILPETPRVLARPRFEKQGRGPLLAAELRQLSLAAAAQIADMHALLPPTGGGGGPPTDAALSAMARLLVQGVGVGGEPSTLAPYISDFVPSMQRLCQP